MELKRHLDPKYIFIGLYVVLLVVYIVIGLKPADATNYPISGKISIPEINLESDVTTLELNKGKLDAPDRIIGSFSTSPNKTLLIGHSTTVFQNLNKANLGEYIFYNNKSYRINNIEIKAKSDIHMGKLLKETEKDTIVLMTCAGELFENGDATHRLIITAAVE
ncbi:sortase [Candidatus Saccharibacteria bacterium]|nr:sortase [Candidatus Saccharibacteria bacterium]